MVCCKVTLDRNYCCQRRCKSDCLYCLNDKGPTFNPEMKRCPYYIPVTDKQYNEIKNFNECEWVRFKQNLVK